MHAIVISAAVALVAMSASNAEARARFKFRSSSSSVAAPVAKPAPVQTTAPASPSGGGIVSGALIGASIAARPARAREGGANREDLPTASTARIPFGPAPLAAPAKPAAAPAAKPAFVCAADKTVGRGSGFCNLN